MGRSKLHDDAARDNEKIFDYQGVKMENRLSRSELIFLAEKIMRAEGSETEIDSLIEEVERNIPDPNISDLIFWNKDNLTATEIIDKALRYKPIIL